MVKDQDCEILFLQETHRGEDQNRPKINGMTLIIERPHNKYGSAIFVKSNIADKSASKSKTNIEILTVDVGKCSIMSIYKPPSEKFVFEEPENFTDTRQTNKIIKKTAKNCKLIVLRHAYSEIVNAT